MKKLISLMLCILLALSCLFLASCSEHEEPQGAAENSIGVGVYAVVDDVTDASGPQNGKGSIGVTAAAVLLDKDGRIVKAKLDSIDITLAYTSAGKFVPADEFKSKYELGDDYNMKTYAASALEWYQQADAFANLTVGKTIDEVKAMVATGGKGTQDVISANCTIIVADFALAIERAVNNAKISNVSLSDRLSVNILAEQDLSDTLNADGDKKGKNAVALTFLASTVSSDGTATAAMSDALSYAFEFNGNGAGLSTEGAKISSTRTLKDAYGMAGSNYDRDGDGRILEWYRQADAFDAALVGKNASTVSSLVGADNYATGELVSAGCTIKVNDFVKVAKKALGAQ